MSRENTPTTWTEATLWRYSPADEDVARGARLEADPRTNPQIIADGFLELLRAGLETDPRKVLGSKRPTVRVMVTGQTLTRAVKNGRAGSGGTGTRGNGGIDSGCAGDMGAPYGLIEGSGAAVSLETIERLICDTGLVGELFSPDAAVLDVGRDQRLFTSKQRTGLQTEWGGCADPTCDRPHV